MTSWLQQRAERSAAGDPDLEQEFGKFGVLVLAEVERCIQEMTRYSDQARFADPDGTFIERDDVIALVRALREE